MNVIREVKIYIIYIIANYKSDCDLFILTRIEVNLRRFG